MNQWTPRGADPATHHTLVDGVPSYMYGPLEGWFIAQFKHVVNDRWQVNIKRMQRYDLAARPQNSMAESLSNLGPEALFAHLHDDVRFEIMDWTVYDNSLSQDGLAYANVALEQVLAAGSSKWKVGSRDGEAGLEQRVPQGVQEAAEAAMATPGDVGRLLSEAWHAAFGVNPKPDLAYRKSIEAVEAAVLPKVMPKDSTAHLGKALGQMRSTREWKLPFVQEHSENSTADVVINMMQALWSGHSDRHPGTSSYVLSTQEAAEAAVFLAVPLVAWFSSGAVTQR